LTKWAQLRTLPAGDVFRARLILALADGCQLQPDREEFADHGAPISRRRQATMRRD